MTQVNIELITFFVSRMSRDQKIEWAGKMPDNIKDAVRNRLRGIYE
jgi:hypothetical protein